jgi:fluoroacetyl-CoA thioesterase
MVEPGNTASITFRTDEAATAAVLGSGDLPVLGTPKVVALVEQAAVAAVAGHLGTGSTSVGTHVSLDHLAPTPIGGTVVATATVVALEGPKITFEVAVTDDEKVVARGTHTRFIVDRHRFMEKVSG